MAKRGILNFHIQIETNPYPGIKGYVADLACLMPEWTEWISEQLSLHLQCSSQIHVAWEQAPRPDNRIMLSKTDRDAAGVPRIELHWTKDELDHRTMLEGLRMFGETIAGQDIGRLRISDWVRDGSPYPDGMELAGNHHMGGTRMSADPVDRRGRRRLQGARHGQSVRRRLLGVRHRRPVHADDHDHRAGAAPRRPSEPRRVVVKGGGNCLSGHASSGRFRHASLCDRPDRIGMSETVERCSRRTAGAVIAARFGSRRIWTSAPAPANAIARYVHAPPLVGRG